MKRDQPKSAKKVDPLPKPAAAKVPTEGASPPRPLAPPPRWLNLAALMVFLSVFAALATTAGDLGLTWDEPAYLHSVRGNLPSVTERDGDSDERAGGSKREDRHARCGMLRWLAALARSSSWPEARELLSQRAILDAWDYNRFGPDFHPPLSGMLASVGYLTLGRWIDEIAAWRLASGAEFALAVALLFLFLARRYGPWVGGVAAASLALMPRVVGDAHLFGTDMPMMTAWALTALAFWNGLESARWRVAFGVLLGLCFDTKFSAMMVVLPLAVWLFAYRMIPLLSAKRVFVALLGTVLVAWPLALAGAEIVRLSGSIRRVTQQRMLRSVAEPSRAIELDAIIGQDWKSDDRKLQAAARWLAARVPLEPPPDVPPSQWAGFRERLNIDKFIGYVDVRDLGVQPGLPNWFPLLTLPMWLLWCGGTALPRSRELVGPGLRLWLAGLAIAPVVAIGLNPTWWHDTLPQLAHYYQISFGRQGALPDIEIFYLGKKYVYSLPWHNGWVLIGVTVPAAILGLSLVGLWTAARGWRSDPLRVFFVLNMAALPIVRMLPTPAHDGVRLMLPTFFFLAGLAGWGFQLIEGWVERFRSERYSPAPVLAVVASFLLLPPAYWLVRTHPYELSYYNGLVGGLDGAMRRGFEPTYWYDAVTPDVVRAMNDAERGLPRGAVLGLPDPKINPEVFVVLQEMGKLRADIRFSARRPEDFGHIPLLTHSSKASPFTRLLYALKPQAAWGPPGVRLFSLYDPPAVARAWALWVLLDASDHSKPVVVPRADRPMIALAQRDFRALYAAAVRITQDGFDRALDGDEDAATKTAIQRLAARQGAIERLLAQRKEALEEAAEIVNRAAVKRPELLSRLIEYEGYLSSQELGEYLDEGMTPLSR